MNFIEIISIIDKSSIFYCLVKLESIIRSTKSPHLLSFHFLSFHSQSEETLKHYFLSCHPTVRYEIISWSSTPFSQSSLPLFTFTGFDTWIIYSRVYLPLIFSKLDYYLYLDNDLIMNGAIEELWTLTRRAFSTRARLNPNQALLNLLPKFKQKNLEQYSQGTPDQQQQLRPPLMGFVFDVNFAYSGYLNSHFNLTHPLVIKVRQMNHPEIFFNAGVAVVNAIQWRKENVTRQAEALLLENTKQPGALFDSQAVGDQGLFYLLLNGRMIPLPPKFNMRRLPNKTVRFLERNELGDARIPSLAPRLDLLTPLSLSSIGITHFAGTTRGISSVLCENPLMYPHLSSAAIPLFLSVISSLSSTCSVSRPFIPSACWKAIDKVKTAVQHNNLTINYNPGSGKFCWPPVERKTDHLTPSERRHMSSF
jgi:lipopolysaccharide biosynthesis glycosyltransferase